jgi:hypothetical protein
VREDAGAIGVLGGPAQGSGEDHGDLLGTADADVVGVEEVAGPAGVVEDEGARDLDLAHREFPEVAGSAVSWGEGRGDDPGPAVEEALHIGRTEAVADALEDSWVLAGSEAVGEFGEGQALVARLPLGPLVAVGPDFGRVGEVGADLDEAGAEVGVGDVEVVGADAAVLLDELEADGNPARRRGSWR